MKFPLSTLQAARLLQVPDHRLTGLVRLEKVTPPLVLGRRAWGPEEVLAAARLVGRDSPELRRMLKPAENAPPAQSAVHVSPEPKLGRNSRRAGGGA